MPELARKLGKMMQEFRGTANDFKQTWEREVDFEKEIKSFDPAAIEAESASVPRVSSISPESVNMPEPVIKEVDPAALDRLKAKAEAHKESNGNASEVPETADLPQTPPSFEPANDKRNWL